jgi:hypothetical protein
MILEDHARDINKDIDNSLDMLNGHPTNEVSGLSAAVGRFLSDDRVTHSVWMSPLFHALGDGVKTFCLGGKPVVCGYGDVCLPRSGRMSAKSQVPYRQCSAGRDSAVRMIFGASIVDTEICAEPGELWQDNCGMGIECIASNFLRPECEDHDRDAEACCQKGTTLSATRGAGLVQIANALTEPIQPSALTPDNRPL